MFLDKIFDDLVYGGLRHVYMNIDNEMTVGIDYRREIAALVSTILTDLHTKLNLKYGEALVTPVEKGEVISFTSDNPKIQNIINNVDNSLEIIRFTYRDNCGKIKELSSDDWDGLSRISYNEFNVGHQFVGESIYVSYIANHEPLDIDKCVHSPESVWIELPNSLYNALLLGVCARKLGTTGIAQTGSNQGYINYYQQYQLELQNIVMDGKDLGQRHLNTDNFRTEGWV